MRVPVVFDEDQMDQESEEDEIIDEEEEDS
jgi:hypothetical protein